MKIATILFLLVYVLIAFTPIFSLGQTPSLGRASGFTVFTMVGAVTNTGATIIRGNIGTNSGAFSGFPPGVIKGSVHIADSITNNSATDAGLAYNYLAALTCGTVIGTTLGSGQVLTPDIYCLGGASTLNGNLVLDGQGDANALFIFKINGSLFTGNASNIVLINGATMANVYWQVNGEFDLGDTAVFKGTIIANGAINLLDKSSFSGRAISIAGAISMHDNILAPFGNVYFKSIGYSVFDSSKWTYNKDGSEGNDFYGTMADENIIWHLQNVDTAVENNVWVMGANSWMLLGDSIHAISFTINNGYDLFGLIDTVNSNATLIIKSDSIPLLNIARLKSTVSYSKIGNQLIRPIIYGNLNITGTGSKTLIDDTIVMGNLTSQ